jgi:hypothetical protein
MVTWPFCFEFMAVHYIMVETHAEETCSSHGSQEIKKRNKQTKEDKGSNVLQGHAPQ